jgi:hypothetical protein
LIVNELLQTVAKGQQSGFSVVDYQVLGKEHTKAIMMLFGLCCKKERDARALEVANLTSQQNLELLRNYAAKNGRVALINKVTIYSVL